MAFTHNPRWYRAADGGLPIIRSYREADSQSFLVGQLVYLSSGYVTATASDGVILGIALKAATNVTSGHIMIPVMIIRPGDEILIETIATSTATLATAANMGIGYGLVVASNICRLDFDETTTDRFQITKLLYDADQSTVKTYVVATCNPTGLQYVTGA